MCWDALDVWIGGELATELGDDDDAGVEGDGRSVSTCMVVMGVGLRI
jgi:hypothetical protein